MKTTHTSRPYSGTSRWLISRKKKALISDGGSLDWGSCRWAMILGEFIS